MFLYLHLVLSSGATCFALSPLIKQLHYIEAKYDATNSWTERLQLNNHPVTSPQKDVHESDANS